jgi:integrase/recombinase XerD
MPRTQMPPNGGDRFYPSDEKHVEYIDTILDRALNGKPTAKDNKELPHLSQDDVGLIREFVSEIQATSHITVKRAYKYTYILVHWRAYIGEFRKNTIGDIYTGIAAIEIAKNVSGYPLYARHTLADYVGFLKKFYIWMVDSKYSLIEEKKLNKIKPPKVTQMTKTAEQLLSEEDVRNMIDTCTNSRDRAIIAMMYEGGFRIGEIASLRWHQLKFNDWNVAVNVDNKTRKPRYVPLVMARPYLATWKNDYPRTLTDDGYVFLTLGQNEQLQYRGFAKQLEKIAKRAGIVKHVTPHIFLHSRITHLIQQGFSESKIKLMMWGDINSDMFKAYAHLTNADIDNEVAQHAGITLPDQKQKSDLLEPKQCRSCYRINEPGVRFCGNCGLPLTPEAGNKLIEARQEARLLPDYQALKDDYNHKIQKPDYITAGIT